LTNSLITRYNISSVSKLRPDSFLIKIILYCIIVIRISQFRARHCLRDPTFSRFSRTPACDRRTDRQKDRQTHDENGQHCCSRPPADQSGKRCGKLNREVEVTRKLVPWNLGYTTQARRRSVELEFHGTSFPCSIIVASS